MLERETFMFKSIALVSAVLFVAAGCAMQVGDDSPKPAPVECYGSGTEMMMLHLGDEAPSGCVDAVPPQAPGADSHSYFCCPAGTPLPSER
jgi:hypothetical protein